jgi:hypothetical protein
MTTQRYGDIASAKVWYKETLTGKVIKALEKNNMSGFYVKTKDEAREKILNLIPEGTSVGYGGSVSLEQSGILESLRKGNYRLIDRSVPGLTREQTFQLRKDSLTARVFLMSTNALTMDGKLVNIDGYGNRVAALSFGPARVIILAGVNKIVPDLEAAISRIKNYVCPLHAHRMELPVPCATTAECADCRSRDRFCCITNIVEYQLNKERITVIICGEELGL